MGIIRTLLAISIVIHHTYPLYGLELLIRDPALKAFFIISGFYMALILNEKYTGKNGGYMFFISNRFLRIYPTYWLILVLTIIFSFLFLHQNVILSFMSFISNFTLLIRTDLFQVNSDLRQSFIIPQAYTLVLELFFYLIAPLIVKKSSRIILSISIGALAIHFSIYAYLRLIHAPLSDWFFPASLIYFMMGVIAYKLYTFVKVKNISNKINYIIYFSLILLTIFYSFIPISWEITSILKLKEWLYMVIIMFSIPFIFKFTSKNSLDRVIGELSYPIYISHNLIILILYYLLPLKQNQSSTTLLVLFITLLVSFCIHYFFEKPIDKFRSKRIKKIKNILN